MSRGSPSARSCDVYANPMIPLAKTQWGFIGATLCLFALALSIGRYLFASDALSRSQMHDALRSRHRYPEKGSVVR